MKKFFHFLSIRWKKLVYINAKGILLCISFYPRRFFSQRKLAFLFSARLPFYAGNIGTKKKKSSCQKNQNQDMVFYSGFTYLNTKATVVRETHADLIPSQYAKCRAYIPKAAFSFSIYTEGGEFPSEYFFKLTRSD